MPYTVITRRSREPGFCWPVNDTAFPVIERPKVIYNEKNDNYVMWFHADGPTETSN